MIVYIGEQFKKIIYFQLGQRQNKLKNSRVCKSKWMDYIMSYCLDIYATIIHAHVQSSLI